MENAYTITLAAEVVRVGDVDHHLLGIEKSPSVHWLTIPKAGLASLLQLIKAKVDGDGPVLLDSQAAGPLRNLGSGGPCDGVGPLLLDGSEDSQYRLRVPADAFRVERRLVNGSVFSQQIRIIQKHCVTVDDEPPGYLNAKVAGMTRSGCSKQLIGVVALRHPEYLRILQKAADCVAKWVAKNFIPDPQLQDDLVSAVGSTAPNSSVMKSLFPSTRTEANSSLG